MHNFTVFIQNDIVFISNVPWPYIDSRYRNFYSLGHINTNYIFFYTSNQAAEGGKLGDNWRNATTMYKQNRLKITLDFVSFSLSFDFLVWYTSYLMNTIISSQPYCYLQVQVNTSHP